MMAADKEEELVVVGELMMRALEVMATLKVRAHNAWTNQMQHAAVGNLCAADAAKARAEAYEHALEIVKQGFKTPASAK
jgi:hypothetical protein